MRILLFAAALLSFCVSSHSGALTAKSWIITDERGQLITSNNADEVRAIASITKLMTSLVVLDAQQDPQENIRGRTRASLLQLALVHSDNAAAATLCDYYPGGKSACVEAMNLKARSLGMTHTRYVEATGLSVFNVSTAEDLVKLIQVASKYPEVRQAAQTTEIRESVSRRVRKHKKVHTTTITKIAHNTNSLVREYNFIVSKTGFINASGGCIAFMVDTAIGRRIVVLLGSKNTRTRIPEAAYLIEKKP